MQGRWRHSRSSGGGRNRSRRERRERQAGGPAGDCRAGAAGGRGTGAGTPRRPGVAKSVDLVRALGPEDRAGAVQQPSARLQRGPQGVEQRGLGPRQGGDVAGTAQPAHVGVAPHDARGGAGASSRMAPNGRPSHQASGAGRRRPGCGRPGRAGEGVVDACEAARGSPSRARRSRSASSSRWAVLPPGAAQASSTRARAGAPRARAPRIQQQPRRQLGPGVLHRDVPLGEARQLASPGTARPARRRAARTPRRPARPRAGARVAGRIRAPRVHPQRHRRPAVVGGEQRRPLVRPVARQALGPPAGWLCTATGSRSASATTASASRRKRRSTALTNEPLRRSRRRAAVPPGPPGCAPGTAARRAATAARATSAAGRRPGAAASWARGSARCQGAAQPAQHGSRAPARPGGRPAGTRPSASVSECPARTACTASAVWPSRRASGSDGAAERVFTARSLRRTAVPADRACAAPLRSSQALFGRTRHAERDPHPIFRPGARRGARRPARLRAHPLPPRRRAVPLPRQRQHLRASSTTASLRS